MANKRSNYAEEFKLDLVQQVLVGGKLSTEVSASSGVEISSLYGWMRKYKKATHQENISHGNGRLPHTLASSWLGTSVWEYGDGFSLSLSL